jgi:hypothetical protein
MWRNGLGRIDLDLVRQTAEQDGPGVANQVEPGSPGRRSKGNEALARTLPGYLCGPVD